MNATTTQYLYDGEDILKEYDGSGNLLATFVHGPGIDEPIAMTRGGQTSYYHADGLGSFIGLTNSSEAVVQTYEYDSFGNITNQTGTIQNTYTYTAREFDTESGLYYYRARYYDPQIGRFISSDPIGFLGGDINLYRYVKNNPVNLIDPSGEILNLVAIGVTVTVIGLSVVFAVDTVIKFLEPALEKKARALEELAEGGSGEEDAIKQIQEAQIEIAKGAELAAGFCKLDTAVAPTPLTK